VVGGVEGDDRDLEGKNGWFHAAEDQLEALKLRNGRAEGDDIPAGPSGALRIRRGPGCAASSKMAENR
jgi:hypothetical protein